MPLQLGIGSRRSSPALSRARPSPNALRDPVCGPAFAGGPNEDARHEIWRSYISAAMRFPWTWLSAGDEATSVWYPPGTDEMKAELCDGYVAIARDHLGSDVTDRVIALYDRFDAARPQAEPHYYLSLLGTHPDHRDAGHGMRLLAGNLEIVDRQGLPAHLESTNPANDDRCGRVGFEAVGSFEGYVPGSTITTMWRPARR